MNNFGDLLVQVWVDPLLKLFLRQNPLINKAFKLVDYANSKMRNTLLHCFLLLAHRALYALHDDVLGVQRESGLIYGHLCRLLLCISPYMLVKEVLNKLLLNKSHVSV